MKKYAIALMLLLMASPLYAAFGQTGFGDVVSGSGDWSNTADNETSENLEIGKALTVGTTNLVVTEGGNVGINDSSPAARLDIKGAGTTTGQALHIADSANTDRFVVLDNGRVGIGTASPVTSLHIKGNDEIDDLGAPLFFETIRARFMYATSPIANAKVAFGSGWGTIEDFAVHTKSSGVFSENTQRFVVKMDGNVGIGTASPSAKLEVSGDVKIATDLSVSRDLTVEGEIYVTGSTGESSVTYGSGEDMVFVNGTDSTVALTLDTEGDTIVDQDLTVTGDVIFMPNLPSGSTEPAGVVAGQLWYDSDDQIVKVGT